MRAILNSHQNDEQRNMVAEKKPRVAVAHHMNMVNNLLIAGL